MNGPKTLDELLEVVPGLRCQRAINADWLRVLLNRRGRACTWCGADAGKRLKWCSDECVQAFQLRCCSTTARSFVIKRDGGLCRECGRDTVASERQFDEIEQQKRKAGELPGGWKEREAILEPIRRSLGWARGRWYEVDHLLPVVEGGGLCDPANLRLLCGECHAGATKKLAGKRKKK